MLEIHNLSIHIGKQLLLDNLSLTLAPGEVNIIIGPNGTGKTTLLKALFGEQPISQGHVIMDGRAMHQQRLPLWRKQFGYMPQDTHMDLDLSVLEVVLLGELDQLGMHVDDQTILKALSALDKVGLVDIADRPIYALSGGQRQMALFAQVLLRNPRLMMLDEPVSALDLHHQIILMNHLHRKTREEKWVTLVVLHDLNLAAQYGDKLIVLADKQLQAFGSPREVLTPERLEALYHTPVSVSLDEQGHPYIRALRYQESLH